MKKPKTVSLDPPWPEQGAGKIKRGADRHYGLIKKKEDMLRVILQADAWPSFDKEDSAHMYMWVTNNYLEWGLDIMRWLGFTYKTNIVWVKTKADWPSIMDEIIDKEGGVLNPLNWMRMLAQAIRIGIGQYFRGSHELMLFGVRGPAMMPDKADMVPTVFHAPREKEDGKEKHSKKPKRSYEIIEATSPGPYLEFFARSRRPGWDSWGREAPKS